ncbi:MAG TPA: class I SAM-dependent methyltransferase [Pseudomonadales bacterium]|nr:class I SAM-dependent methyltransferase [Pseudomonadales bacterium]
MTASLVGAIKRRTPTSLYPFARSLYHRVVAPVECWSVATADRLLGRTYEGRSLPPAALRFKVRGTPDGNAFASIGRSCARDLRDTLATSGRKLDDFHSILDFGCGCGGTLVWLRDLAPTAALSGTDIDDDAIGWCRANLPFGRFDTNDATPPLAYADASFDLVYAVSVFSHLDEDFQFQWLQELRRILAPGGTCLITLHGPGSWNEIPERDEATLTSRGFVFVRTKVTRGLFPDWYQTAFHTRAYVEDRFSRYFDVIGFVPRGMASHQDVVVLQRRLNAP